MKNSLMLMGLAVAGLAQADLAYGQPAGEQDASVNVLEEVVVVGDRIRRELVDVDGTRIYAGKLTSVALLADLPPIEGPAFRQAFAEIPGLLISEVSNGSWQSVSYRGLGEPHESWNLLTLQDGLPVSPDLYSYPAAYFTPPLDTVDRIEFVRGGSGLLYGPQPGGTLNYVTWRPTRADGFGAQARLSAGSDALRSALAAADARVGDWRLWGHWRDASGDGPRRANADFDQRSGALRAEYVADGWTLGFGYDDYEGSFGEPGGLSPARFAEDREAVSTPLDRLFITRRQPFITLDAAPGDWVLAARLFRSEYERTSRRQAGGSFGLPTPAANVAVRQTQDFFTTGLDLRARRDFRLGGGEHSLTFGTFAYDSDAPVIVAKGATPVDDRGLAGLLALSERRGRSYALFGEVKLDFGRLTLVPGLRAERIRQRVEERLDLALGAVTGGPPGGPNGPLGRKRSEDDVLLWGLGASFDLSERVRLVGNVSRGFKPKLFNDGVTFQAGVDVADTFDATYALTTEAGLQWRPAAPFVLDASLFRVEFDDQVGFLAGPLPAAGALGAVGIGGVRRQNVGSMRNQGVDLAGAIDVLSPSGGWLGTHAGQLRVAVNAQWLDAEFVSGPARGATPQYAPRLLSRLTLSYERPEGLRLALFATHVADQNGADNDAVAFAIPAYTVLDATAEWRFGNGLSVGAGANNLLDRRYVGRIRPGAGQGLDPGLPRNGYLSVGYRF